MTSRFFILCAWPSLHRQKEKKKEKETGLLYCASSSLNTQVILLCTILKNIPPFIFIFIFFLYYISLFLEQTDGGATTRRL
jgi:hypothetical protein